MNIIQNVFIYLRKSRAEELNDTTDQTLYKHRQTLLEYAKENQLHILHIYEEVASGESLYSRPQMLEMLEQVEQKQCDAVLCMDIDRLGRGGMREQGMILETFKYSDTKIITPRRFYDLNNDLDEEYTEFETFMARRELKTITRRMRQGIERTIQDGGYIANAPYGYQKTTRGKLPTLAIIEQEANFVRMIFHLYVHKRKGCQTIAEIINNLGARPHRGTQFSRSTVLTIIRNQVYIGKVVWNQKNHIKKNIHGNTKYITNYNPKEKWTIVDGIHPPIIDTELFYQAQEILAGRYHAPYQKGILYNPLSGLVYCSKCGALMTRRHYSKTGNYQNPYTNFICPTRGCSPCSRMKDVEQAVLNSLKQMINELKAKQQLLKQHDQTQQLLEIQQLLQKELQSLKLQKDNIYTHFERGYYNLELFQNRIAIVNQRNNKLLQQLQTTQQKIKNYQNQNFTTIISNLEQVLEQYQYSNINVQNELLKSVINHILFSKHHGDKIDQFQIELHLKGLSDSSF